MNESEGGEIYTGKRCSPGLSPKQLQDMTGQERRTCLQLLNPDLNILSFGLRLYCVFVIMSDYELLCGWVGEWARNRERKSVIMSESI